MAASFIAFQLHCCATKHSIPQNSHHLNTARSSTFKPKLGQLSWRINVLEVVKNTSVKLLDAFVDSTFEFSDLPLLPAQSNFAPTDELKEAVVITNIEGKISDDFPEGAYLRNGPNPLAGGLKSTKSMFGRSNHIWVEGEGMIHALYFEKGIKGKWTVIYNKRYVETKMLKLEKQRNKPSFLPTVEGDSSAIVSTYLLNLLRFGKVNKLLSNTNIIEHSGKVYSITETHLPQEIDMLTLETFDNWDVNGAWNRPFTSHPKKAPGSGELVIVGFDAIKPYAELGVISADGKKLVHRVDLKLNRCSFIHEILVTDRYNVFFDHALTIDLGRLIRGGQLIKYDKESYSRIGVMPRYGPSGSIKWFEVEPSCTFHIFNSFEDGDEVVVRGCRAFESIIPGPDQEDELLFPRPYEWRLNMLTGHVCERNLTGTKYSLDFPFIKQSLTGIKNKYGYAQVRDNIASSAAGLPKFSGVAKLSFEEPGRIPLVEVEAKGPIKEEYHMFKENTFCTGASFAPKGRDTEEDDGWIITFVHNEVTNISQAYIIDAKKLSGEPVAKITLPCRVPYGFHGAYIPISNYKGKLIST